MPHIINVNFFLFCKLFPQEYKEKRKYFHALHVFDKMI